MMMEQKFNPIKVSSKFPICALPLRLDSYNDCEFNCTYCFSNNRSIGVRTLSSPDFNWLQNKFVKVYDEGDVDGRSFVEVLLKNRITLHGGCQSDCFQPIEEEFRYTKRIVDLCNEYNQKILFSTKSDQLYDVNVTPELHSFQLSFSNLNDDRYLEPNVPLFEKRFEFYKDLIDQGFDVGIRVQPFIPDITDVEKMVELFDDASHFVIESIKLVPSGQNNDFLRTYANLRRDDFTQMGLLNLKPSIRMTAYRSIIELFKSKGISYSIADNDLHHLGNNRCCCGDKLVDNIFDPNNTTVYQEVDDYDLEYILNKLGEYKDCKCDSLYTSARRNGCKTVEDFYKYRFDNNRSIYSPKFQYREKSIQMRLW